MTQTKNEPKRQAARKAAQHRDTHPENLKEQGAPGNLTQNIIPQHRQQDR